MKKILSLTLLLCPLIVSAGEQGKLTQETWNNIPGFGLANLINASEFYSQPDTTVAIDSATSTNASGAAGVRIRGYVTTTLAGDYSFAISGDDAGELRISTSNNKFLAIPIASFEKWTSVGQWDKYPSQQSGAITLQAGQKIFVEMLLKEGGGADHVSLGWKVPGSANFTMVPTAALESYVFSEDTNDANGNEMPDDWEAQYPLPIGQDGQLDDPDKDGYLNFEESQMGTDPNTHGGILGYLTFERWDGIGAGKLEALESDAEFRLSPYVSELIAGAATTPNQGDRYGARLHGYVIAPFDGDFTFYVSGDDNVSLSLSSDKSKFNKVQIADHHGYTSIGQFTKNASQKSEVIPMLAGNKYYIEGLLKEGHSSDHLSIGWEGTPAGLTNWVGEAGVSATQSSLYGNGVADKAIDGINSGSQEASSFTHTLDEQGSWLEVDLGQARSIESVHIHNRSNWASRLTNFKVSVIDASGLTVISKSFYTEGGYPVGKEVWNLDSAVQGSKVKVELLGSGFLSLAEVEVYNDSRQFEVSEIPSSAIESYAFDVNDADNDGMKDDWEDVNGLDSTVNDANDDPDEDNAPNWLEFKAGTDPQISGSVQGGLVHELWNGIPGRFVNDLTNSSKYHNKADYKSIATWSAGPFNFGPNHGNRLRGFVTAPITGTYYFWAEGNKQVIVNLSTDDDKFNKETIITTTQFNWINNYEFEYDLAQKSKAVHLIAGQKYFIEVLHKSFGIDGDHFSIAWTKPDSTRELIGAEHLSTFPGQANDLDDDGLEDEWETANGLDNTVAAGVDGANGDLDGDGLTNNEERVNGTSANNVDSDGDGVSDYDEIMLLETEALAGDVAPFQNIQTIIASQYSSKKGEWLILADGITNASTRGELEYNINVPSDGIYLLDLAFDEHVGGNLDNEYVFGFKINDLKINEGTALVGQSGTSNAKTLTPYLSAGVHRVTVFYDNSYSYRRVKIKSLSVLSSQGPDTDSNNRPDWVDARLNATNGIDGVAFKSSRVSPALVEGNARYLSLGTLSGLSPKSAPGDRWYDYVSLANDGAPTTISANFENNAFAASQEISWIPTNLLAETEITLRQGSSLRLTAANAENGTADESVQIVIGQNTYNFTADQPHEYYFGVAGMETISVTHTFNGVIQTRQVTINVVSDVVIADSPIVVRDYWREWDIPALPEDHTLELDDRIIVREVADLDGGGKRLTLTNTGVETLPAIIRNQISGEIIGRVDIRGMRLRDNELTSVTNLEEFEDGTKLIEMPIVLDGLHADAFVHYDIFIGGVLFEDGTISKDWQIPSDFDETGIGKVRFIKSGNWGAACHRGSIWQNGKRIAFLY